MTVEIGSINEKLIIYIVEILFLSFLFTNKNTRIRFIEKKEEKLINLLIH